MNSWPRRGLLRREGGSTPPAPPGHEPSRRRAGQRGQVLAVTALMVPMLLGFTALSVDISNLSAQKRILQSVGDHSALAGGVQMLGGKTRAQATAAAKQIATLDGYQASELSVTYYDSLHVVALTDASVAYVATTITHTVRNYFAGVIGIGTKDLAVAAEAHITNSTTAQSNAWCAICVLNPTMSPAFDNQDGIDIVNGGVEVVSNANGGFSNSGGADVALSGANSFVRVGGPSGSISGPLPVGGTIQYGVTFAQPDPFAYLTQPTSGPPGPGADIIAGATLAPGTYHDVTIGSSTTLTAGGLYVFTGSLNVTGSGSLVSNRSLLYFACPTYPVPCAPGASVGGSFADASGGGAVNVSNIVGGPWDGMAVFYDRNLTTQLSVTDTGGSVFVGGIYMKSGFLNIQSTSQVDQWRVRIAADHVLWNCSGNRSRFDAAGVVGHMLTIVLSK